MGSSETSGIPLKGCYPVTPVIVDWLSNTFQAIHAGEFQQWRAMLPVLRVVQAAEDGKLPRYAALSALRRYNDERQTDITYDEVLTLDSTFLFSDAGEWVVFTDNAASILTGVHDDPDDALLYAADDVQWAVAWVLHVNEIVVYRSPFHGHCQLLDLEHYAGDALERGGEVTALLPPEIQAAVVHDLIDLHNEDYDAALPS